MSGRHTTWHERAALAATALLLAGCSSDSTPGQAAPTDRRDATATKRTTAPTGLADPILSPEPGRVLQLEQPLPLDHNDWEYVFAKEGRYAVHLTPSLAYQVDVPNMWEILNFQFLSTSDYSEGNGLLYVSEAPPGKTWLPTHPSRDRTRVPVAGPTPRALADAVRTQPLLAVSRPIGVMIGGRRGVSVNITIPNHVDEASCVHDSVALYTSPTRSPDWWDGEGGLVASWRILDVDGERWVVVTQCDTSCTKDDFDILTTMAESITFVRDE